MFEVRFHGRGGQGGQMAAQTLAEAAFIEGNYAVGFPFFGAERRGAPILAFMRADKNKIYRKTMIYDPDYVVVLDDSLLETINITQGLKKGGVVIINTRKKPTELELGKCGDTVSDVKVATVDATGVALEILGSSIVNTAILGAFAKGTGKVSMESIKKAIYTRFAPKFGEKAAEKNYQSAKKAYELTTITTVKAEKCFIPKKVWLPTWQELPVGGALRTTKTDAGLVGPGSFIENKTGGWKTFKPILDQGKCTNCLFCWYYCPEGCIERSAEGMKVDLEYCKGCGICAEECPADAIKMER